MDTVFRIQDNKVIPTNFNITFPKSVFEIFITDCIVNPKLNKISAFCILSKTNSSFEVSYFDIKDGNYDYGFDSAYAFAIGL